MRWKNALTLLNFCWKVCYKRDGQCFHGNKTVLEKRRITDDQPFNMLIFRIVFFLFSLLLPKCFFLFIPFSFLVVISNVCRFCFILAHFMLTTEAISILVYLRQGLTNDNGELHPNGVNIRATKRKISLNISCFVSYRAVAYAINRVSALTCLFLPYIWHTTF